MISRLITMNLLILLLLVVKLNSAQISLIQNSTIKCICPGQTLMYECTVEGNTGVTVWSGTAFDCPESENELTFLHIRRFTERSQGCNSGAIFGRGIRVIENTYTSQVNITLDHSMDGKSVTCTYNNGSSTNVIGNTSISLTKDPYPPPTDISVNVSDVLTGPLKLTFKWSPVALDCTAIRYITEFDCGSCPNTTDNTEVVCTDIVIGNLQCTFTVQTQVCDSITGNTTTNSMMLKVPDSPAVCGIIPTYSHDTDNLTALTVLLNETQSFEISDGISGSPTSYSLFLTDSEMNSNNSCFFNDISEAASFVDNGNCHYSRTFNYNSSLSSCQSDKRVVTFSATNMLGSGPRVSYYELIDLSNHFVKVNYSQNLSTVYCTFYTLTSKENKTNKLNNKCTIVYGFNVTEVDTGTMLNSDTVVFHLKPIHSEHRHFKVTACDGINTVYVEGIFKGNDKMFSPENSVPVSNATEVLVYTLIAIVITVGIVIVIILGLVCVSLKNKLKRDKVKTKNKIRPEAPSESSESSMARNIQTEEQLDNRLIYADIGPLSGNLRTITLFSDDRVEYAELNHPQEDAQHDIVVMNHYQDTESKAESADKTINLDSALIQLREEVTEMWYDFGTAIGVPKEVTEKYKGHPSDQCLIETLDYWLRNHPDQPTWREVTQALDAIGLSELSNKITQVYITGKLPIEVDMNANLESILQHKDQPLLNETVSDCNCSNASPPMLPPKGYMH